MPGSPHPRPRPGTALPRNRRRRGRRRRGRDASGVGGRSSSLLLATLVLELELGAQQAARIVRHALQPRFVGLAALLLAHVAGRGGLALVRRRRRPWLRLAFLSAVALAGGGTGAVAPLLGLAIALAGLAGAVLARRLPAHRRFHHLAVGPRVLHVRRLRQGTVVRLQRLLV